MDYNSPTPTPAPTAKSSGRPKKVKTKWKGEWDVKNSKYVGTGDYAGQPKPADHAPSWWHKTKMISGDRYLRAYAKATYHQDLLKVFWFATEDQIASAHDTVNEWCDGNGFERIRKLPERKPRVSEKTRDFAVQAGVLKHKK